MSYLQAVILGIVQGITEFLPISSSGHLAVAEKLMTLGISAAAIEAFDVMVHVATVIAVLIVFRKTIIEAFTTRRRLIALCVIGCIPAGIAGILIKLYGQIFFDAFKASLMCVGAAFIATGLILLLTRFIGKPARDEETARWPDALRVGLYQAAAILPGISRSGATIGAGLIGGMTREFAARFSFVTAVPLILGAAAVDAKHLIGGAIAPGVLASGFIAAFVSGLAALYALLAIVRRGRIWLFAIYLIPLGVGLMAYHFIRG